MIARQGPIIGSLSIRPHPTWLTDGWYSNNPAAQNAAIARWHFPVTTAAERETALRFVASGETFACTSCHRFAFDRPRLCFWCVNNPDTVNKNTSVEQKPSIFP